MSIICSIAELAIFGGYREFLSNFTSGWPQLTPHDLWHCNILLSGQGFFLPNLLAILHSWAIWPSTSTTKNKQAKAIFQFYFISKYIWLENAENLQNRAGRDFFFLVLCYLLQLWNSELCSLHFRSYGSVRTINSMEGIYIKQNTDYPFIQEMVENYCTPVKFNLRLQYYSLGPVGLKFTPGNNNFPPFPS